MERRNGNMRRAWAMRGFTLIELLVVVAIIAVLIAILLPSLGKAKSNARISACLANMHAIALASVTYNNAYDQFMVPEQWSHATNNGAACEAWETLFAREGFIPVGDLAKDPLGANVATTTDATVHTRTAFHCPEQLLSTYHRVSNTSNSPWYNVNAPIIVDSWYELNGQGQQYSSIGSGANFTSGQTPVYQLYDASVTAPPSTQKNYSPRFSAFDSPQGLVLAAEASGVNLRNMTAAAPRWYAPHSGGKVTTLAFVDGHATRYDYKIIQTTTSTATAGFPMGGPLDKTPGKEIHWFTDKNY